MIKAIIKYALGLLMALISGYIIRIYMCQWFGIAEPTIIHSLFIGVLGFCVGINGREPIVAASDYFVFADLTFGCSSGRIKIKGSDGLHYLTWLTEKLEEGDRVLIKMVVTDKVSPVLTIEDCDRNEMKRRYEQLKMELQGKGLI